MTKHLSRPTRTVVAAASTIVLVAVPLALTGISSSVVVAGPWYR